MVKKDLCAKSANRFEQLSYWYSGTFIFLKYGSVLNVTPVTNAFLSCTLLSVCFFSDDILGKHVGPSSIILDIPVSVWVVILPST